MTAPVLNMMTTKENNQMHKMMCFYLPKEHQASPPTPVDPNVKVVADPGFTVYVHTFGGYATQDSTNIEQARIFAAVLAAAGEEADTSTFFSAGYDSPMKFWSRRNEVMYPVTADKLANVNDLL